MRYQHLFIAFMWVLRPCLLKCSISKYKCVVWLTQRESSTKGRTHQTESSYKKIMFPNSAMQSPGNLHFHEERMTLPCKRLSWPLQLTLHVTSWGSLTAAPCHLGSLRWQSLAETCTCCAASVKLMALQVELELRLKVILLNYCWDRIIHSNRC